MKTYIVFGLFVLSLFVTASQPVKAASIEPGCSNIGTIGNIIVSRCYDEETQSILYGNSVGWMSDPIEY